MIHNLTEADLEAVARTRLKNPAAYTTDIVRVPVLVEKVKYAVEFTKNGPLWTFIRVIYPPESAPYTLEDIIVLEGPPGPAGENGTLISRIILTVVINGQTEFNVFSDPEIHSLFINGVEYHTYTIQQVSENFHLMWQGGFSLQTTDELLFTIFKN